VFVAPDDEIDKVREEVFRKIARFRICMTMADISALLKRCSEKRISHWFWWTLNRLNQLSFCVLGWKNLTLLSLNVLNSLSSLTLLMPYRASLVFPFCSRTGLISMLSDSGVRP